MSTVYLCTDAAADLKDSGDLNTPASRAAFARAWELAAVRIGRVAGVTVVADGNVSDPTRHRFNQRNRDAGFKSEAVSDLWQAAHDCVVPGRRNGRWIVRGKAVTAARGRVLKGVLVDGWTGLDER